MKLKVGDLIRCKDKEDMIDTMQELLRYGVNTDFIYEYMGMKGLWLKVTEIKEV